MTEIEGPILYVIVVGFHHKKGCQVEYSFPPLVPDAPNECPAGWKYLPTLALPDGSHNYEQDTVYFHLPSLSNPKHTVYGISCFRQIPVEKLKNRTADLTRSSVQKSVCVLSKLPLYGYIEVKMTLITHAYFDEGDFSKVSLLEDTYRHLNSVLMHNDLNLQIFVGLSARDFILHWKHKALLLFKLLLLERKVVFFRSPVQSLCSTILTLLSLHPLMIEKGLDQSACVKPSRPMSPMPEFSDEDITPEVSPKKQPTEILSQNEDNLNQNNVANGNLVSENEDEKLREDTGSSSHDLEQDISEKTSNSPQTPNLNSSTETEANLFSRISAAAQIMPDECHLPLPIFTTGYLCLPYLSLPYMDLLSDVNVRGYVVGATNVLFKQKRQLHEVLVDVETAKIECQDVELRKQLHLTTEDLRFVDYVVKHVSEEKHDVFLDGVGWEGGEDWIRAQFKVYLTSLMRTALTQDSNRDCEHFNSNFVAAWRDSHNFKIWRGFENDHLIELMPPGHPFSGQLSVADMKLRWTHTMQNTESGRKLNQAMASTGRAVATTSRAVGGALSQAKGAFSNWWSNLLRA
ncbi:late secretory pathway protein AVL9 homolog isoform X2 [Agrilus planipennis]|uniref:Late secretory pathway protein AVL9 homolog isoform X2 n=1 Tax=Agrilus planipennis TaxID=224129 RepID=A0A1W4WMG6_AGRPL|nr:late secretory pathway protein AVL9 homolog isoform X2 [Agrilus planipennis]